MKAKVTLFLAVIAFFTSLSASGTDLKSSVLVHQALQAQGGEEKLRGLHSVQWEASGYRNMLEESERPEGPYFTEFDSIVEAHDLTGNRYRNTTEAVIYPFFKSLTINVLADNVAMTVNEGHNSVGTSHQSELIRERMALSPERLLLTALAAVDTHTEPDMVLQSVPQNVVSFSLDHAPVRIYLNAFTHLPTAVDYSGPLAHSDYWAFLGDVTRRTYYSFWWLAKCGIHFPLQWNIEGNGLPDQMMVIRRLQIDDPLDEATLTIPEDIRKQFQPNAPPNDLENMPLGDSGQPSQELAPGIVFIPGLWNATFIRQDDGIVVLEAPISSGYSAKVIAEVHRRFPGQPIKGVITTSDSWPHLAGIREYVAGGIPIYALNLNQPILERVIDATHKTKPDTQALAPRRPLFHFVHGKTVLGTGPNRIEVFPIHGETGERQMAVYFPEHHLLYGSDLFQKNPDGSFFYPQTVTELMDVVARDHLQVDRFFMMHVGPTSWADLAKAVSTAETKNTPDDK